MFKKLFIALLLIGICGHALALQKNVASQKWVVFAFNLEDNTPELDDEANITASVYIDGSANAVDDTNPTELGGGYYAFDMAQAETNGDNIVMFADSATTGVGVIGMPGAVWTTVAQTGDAYARLGAPAGASVSADIAAVKSDTAAVLVDTAAMDSSTELRTLLFGSDTAGATAANQTTIIGYIDTEVAAVLQDTGTDIPATLATIAGYIDTEVAAILVDTGTTLDDFLDTEIAAILEDTGTTIPGTITTIDDFLDTEIAAILADTNELQTDWVNGGRLDLLLDGAASAGDPWTTALPGAYGAGTAGYIIGSMGAATDPWGIALPGAYTSGEAGYILGTYLNAPVATIDTVVDAIKAKTDSLTFTGAGIVDANVVNWKGSAAAAMTGDAYARLGAPAGASVSADVAAVKSDSAAILTDTAAADTANELRTLLTGGTSALSILTTSDNIGINWGDVSNPTTAVGLTGTTISTSQAVASVTGAVGSVTGAVGSVTGAVGSVTAGVTVTTNNDKTGYALSAAGIDAIWDEVQSGHATAGSFGLYLDSKVSEAGGGTVPTADEIADQVWNELLSGHAITGSTGAGLSAASAAGDPWSVDVSTGYTGQAGEYLRNIKDSTDGDKEGATYSTFEQMIRSNR